MTSRAARCARLLRVRSVEHRVATRQLSEAEEKLLNLVGIAKRAAALRTAFTIGTGQSDGLQIQGIGALAVRLRSATANLDWAISTAQDLRASRATAKNIAQRAEDHVARVSAAAAYHDVRIVEQRRSAALPAIRRITTRLAE